MSEMRKLAEYAAKLRYEDLSEEVIRAAKFCVMDTIGAALGGERHEDMPAVVEEINRWSNAPYEHAASVWGHGKKMDVFQASLLNGMMSHALELDDVHAESKSHVGAVVVPAAWVMAEATGADGKSFLEAVIVGYEVMARVGMAMDVSSNRKRGWHATGIIGTFGAAAACGRILGLDANQMTSALGMAGTQSSGLWAFLKEGATCKKLHTGRAAANGIAAAIYAKAGMTGPEHILDAEDGGLYRAISDSYDLSILTKNLGSDFAILKMDKKPYPCCRTTHHAIDAAIALRDELDYKQIESIQIGTYDVGVLQCGFPNYPKSCVEAKFSIAYTVAAALVFGRLTQAEFTYDVLNHPDVMRIASHTTVTADTLFSERYPKRWGSKMDITLKDGTHFTKQVDDMSGSVNNPMSEKQEKDKFTGLVCINHSEEEAKTLCEQILSIETMKTVSEI